MKKFILLLTLLVFVPGNLFSQNLDADIKQQQDSFDEFVRSAHAEFKTFKKDIEQEYKSFRDSINAEYAKFMEEAWTEGISKPAKQALKTPLPPVIATPEEEKTPIEESEPINTDSAPSIEPIKEGTYPQKREPSNKPKIERNNSPSTAIALQSEIERTLPKVTPKPKDSQSNTEKVEFEFYGTPCSINLSSTHKFTLSGVDEKSVANAWRRLSANDYTEVVNECLKYREELNLCDWGYLRFVEIMSENFFGKNLDEARVMQMFILTQSGYKVRIARGANRLVLLLPSNDEIYNYSYLNIGGTNYYVLDNTFTSSSFYVFNREFPQEQWFALGEAKEPLLAKRQGTMRYYNSQDGKCSATFKLNNNIIDFYRDYPRNGKWDVYSKTSLSGDAKKALYPQLKKSIDGKNKANAANILLNFVQTAFEYKTDEEQFGEERPLFADETLYYPYCDCEDRAILYSILVHELLNLDVLLLHYPNHIATAVCFESDNIKGDSLSVNGKRYIICDPTYIGASIGRTMPNFKGVSPKVIHTW